MKRLALIFAAAKNGVIGRAGQLPWDYPEDRAYFLRMTEGHAVILGRRTWEERGTPLPNRTNIVVSKTFVPPPMSGMGSGEGSGRVVGAATLDEALEKAWAIDNEPFVIGGVRLFEEALPRATRVYMTEVPGEPEGDAILSASFRAHLLDRDRLRVVSSEESKTTPGLRFVVLEAR